MELDLVGYICGSLDPDERSRTEEALRNDATARTRLERIRSRLAPLELVRDTEAPPVGLADRTLGFITDRVRANRPIPVRRSVHGGSEPVYSGTRWKRIDVAVAAGILIVIGGLSVSGVSRVHQRYEVASCQNNMRQIHHHLASYSQDHGGRFPQVTEQPPNNFASAFVPILQQSGYFPATGAPACPGSYVVSAVPVAGGYAYSLGYRDKNGNLIGMTRDQDSDLLPILADRESPLNHRGGHNVLYIGGNARFATTPTVGMNGDHIFRNEADAIAAGLHRLDTVLGKDHTRP